MFFYSSVVVLCVCVCLMAMCVYACEDLTLTCLECSVVNGMSKDLLFM